MTRGAHYDLHRKPLKLRDRKSRRPHRLPAGWRWLELGERTRIGDVVCDVRIMPVTIAEGDGWVMTPQHHPVRRKIDPLTDARARLAAAQAREARLVGALEDFLHVCNFATFDNGVVADNGANEGDYLAGQVMDRAKAALTPNGTALAAAIEAWLTADERERKARGTISDDEAHDSALQALDAAGDALRAAWRGA